MTSGRQREVSMPRLSDGLAIAAACIFIFLAVYRIDLPGLYYDELAFVNAAQGAPDNTMIHMRLGSVPLLIMPYLGGLKGMDLRSRFPPFRRVGFDYPLACHSDRGCDAADLLPRHAAKSWGHLGGHRGLDNGGRSG